MGNLIRIKGQLRLRRGRTVRLTIRDLRSASFPLAQPFAVGATKASVIEMCRYFQRSELVLIDRRGEEL